MAKNKPQVNAAIYLRISSDPTGRQLGVTRQREDCTALCEQRGWQPVEYVDNDTSASSGKRRPAYERMLTDIHDGVIGAVVAWDLDRLHRRPIELESFMALADERHLALATVSGDIDLSTAQGRLTARLKGSVAAHEIEHKRARQLRAAQQKAERGDAQWRNAFGYMRDGSRQPDPHTAPLVKRVYAHVLAGGSISDGARMLNEESAFGLSGRPWTASTLSLFLRKPRNAGLRSHNGTIVGKGNWSALVDESMWRAVQSVLNAPGRGPGRKTVRRHLLTGVLQCGKPGCGGYLSGMHTADDKRIAYACKSCRGVAVRSEHITPLIYELVTRRLAKPDAVDLLKAELHDAQKAQDIRDQLAALYGELDCLAVERAEGLLTARQVKISTDIINDKIIKLEHSQQDQERLRVFDGIPLGKPEVAEAIAQLSPDRFRAVLDVLATVTVMPVGKSGRVFNPERVQVIWR